MNRILDAMRGTLLTAADIRTVRNRPDAVRLPLSWGVGDAYRGGRDYQTLTLTKRGFQRPMRGERMLRIPAAAVKRHFTGRRHRCRFDPDFQAMECQRQVGRETHAVAAFYPCIGSTGGRQGACPGPASSMQIFWGTDRRRVSKAMTCRIVDDVFLPGARLATGGPPPPAFRSWLLRNLDGATHVADVDGLHFEIDPGTLFTDRRTEVSLQVSAVRGP